MAWTLDDFDYPLPQELIAQAPLARRTDSRLLQVSPQLADLQFSDLPRLLAPGDLLVFNDTRVIKARFFGLKESGGKVEIMLERIVDATHAICQIRASKAPKQGSKLILADAFTVTMTGRAGADGGLEAIAAAARRHEIRHGRVDPSLQAFQRGHACARGRSLCCGGTPEG